MILNKNILSVLFSLFAYGMFVVMDSIAKYLKRLDCPANVYFLRGHFNGVIFSAIAKNSGKIIFFNLSSIDSSKYPR